MLRGECVRRGACAAGAGRGARGAAVQWAAQRSEGREQSPRPAERGAHNKDVVSLSTHSALSLIR